MGKKGDLRYIHGASWKAGRCFQDLVSANDCTLLMELIFALNLAYPPTLHYAFEVFQKPFLDLDGVKVSQKVQSLKLKLLS